MRFRLIRVSVHVVPPETFTVSPYAVGFAELPNNRGGAERMLFVCNSTGSRNHSSSKMWLAPKFCWLYASTKPTASVRSRRDYQGSLHFDKNVSYHNAEGSTRFRCIHRVGWTSPTISCHCFPLRIVSPTNRSVILLWIWSNWYIHPTRTRIVWLINRSTDARLHRRFLKARSRIASSL